MQNAASTLSPCQRLRGWRNGYRTVHTPVLFSHLRSRGFFTIYPYKYTLSLVSLGSPDSHTCLRNLLIVFPSLPPFQVFSNLFYPTYMIFSLWFSHFTTFPYCFWSSFSLSRYDLYRVLREWCLFFRRLFPLLVEKDQKRALPFCFFSKYKILIVSFNA